MEESARRPAERGQEAMWLTMLARYVWSDPGISVSIGTAIVLLAWDIAITGSCALSFILCPIWLVASLAKNAIQRPGWRLGILRIAVPAVTFALAVANSAFELRVAEANALRVVAACEQFNAANSSFPNGLDELVPRYMPCIPRAKYCLLYGEFVYLNLGKPMLVWYVVPPFNRKIYDFETRRWRYMD